jgi:hypothetical protein
MEIETLDGPYQSRTDFGKWLKNNGKRWKVTVFLIGRIDSLRGVQAV